MTDAEVDDETTGPDGDDDGWEREAWARAAQDYREQRGSRPFLVEYTPQELARLRALLDDSVSLKRAYAEIHTRHFAGRAAESTVEALMLGLRERGTAALQEPKVRGRLVQLSKGQLREVAGRLGNPKPKIARPWSSVEIEHLLMAWRELTHG